MIERPTWIQSAEKSSVIELLRAKINQLLFRVSQWEQPDIEIPIINEYTLDDMTTSWEPVSVSVSRSVTESQVFEISVSTDNTRVSTWVISVCNTPYPHFILEDLKTISWYEWRWYARVVMRHLERFLLQVDCPWFLLSILWEDDPAEWIYERSWWQILPITYMWCSVFTSSSYDQWKLKQIVQVKNY